MIIIVCVTIDSIVIVMHSADRATTVIVIVMIAILIDLIQRWHCFGLWCSRSKVFRCVHFVLLWLEECYWCCPSGTCTRRASVRRKHICCWRCCSCCWLLFEYRIIGMAVQIRLRIRTIREVGIAAVAVAADIVCSGVIVTARVYVLAVIVAVLIITGA